MDQETLKLFLHMIAEECKANRELAAKILASNEARLEAAMEFLKQAVKK